MPSSICCPFGRHAPALRAGHLGVAEHVVTGMPVEDPAPVHPRAEVGRDRHIRGRRHDMRGEYPSIALAAADLAEDFAKPALRGHFPAGQFRHGSRRRHRNHGRGQQPALRRHWRAERPAVEERPEFRLGNIQPLEPSHSWPGRTLHDAWRNVSICSSVIRPGMVVLVAANGSPIPLIVYAIKQVGWSPSASAARQTCRELFQDRGRPDCSSNALSSSSVSSS